jgi:hypothetical protein
MAGERGSGWVIAATASCGSRGVSSVTVTKVLLTDSHSGLSDRLNYQESSDQSLHIPFPEGANPWFLQAAKKLGVTVLAADASRVNQNEIRRVGEVSASGLTDVGGYCPQVSASRVVMAREWRANLASR